MQLTQENYYTLDAEREYFSTHQFKSWKQCPARQKALLDEKIQEPENAAFLFGQYVDTCLTEPEQLPTFIKKHPEIFKKDGELKAEYQLAQKCVERVQRDEAAMGLLSAKDAEFQKIVTGELFGVPWKGMLDIFVPSLGVFVDLKTTRTLGLDRTDRDETGKPQPWYNKYWLQMSVYRDLLYQETGTHYEPMILAVTKHDPPGLRGLIYPEDNERVQALLQWQMDEIEEDLPQFYQWKHQGVDADGNPPRNCVNLDDCDWCRQSLELDLDVAQ